MPVYKIKFNNNFIESHNDTPLDLLIIDIAKDTKKLSDINKLNNALQATLSRRTINFVNRYELVHHILNTLSGFSATIFRDLGK